MSLKSDYPISFIVEVCELFQEFLKLTLVDGFVDTWCLEISLQNTCPISHSSSKDLMHHIVGLHSFCHLLIKKLEEQNHEISAQPCNCGWEESDMPKTQHTDIHRYTPGTIIRWSQGECHVLLAPQQVQENGTENTLDKTANASDAEIEKECDSNESKSLSEESHDNSFEELSENIKTESPELDNGQHEDLNNGENCLHNMSNRDYEDDSLLHIDNSNNNTSTVEVKEEQTSFSNRDSEDENSCMLVINEDGDINPEEDKVKADELEQPSPHCYFNVSLKSNLDCNDEDVENTDSDNDETCSVSSTSSTSSTSSSSSSSSSSSTSSDDDDRINFKKRVEQAAQAAREATAAAAASAHEARKCEQLLSNAAASETAFVSNEASLQPINEDALVDGDLSFQSPSYSTSRTTSQRHPDDIQAAQGLAALGKSQDGPSSSTERQDGVLVKSRSKSSLSKAVQHLWEFQKADFKLLKIDSKSFQCDVCGKVFKRIFNLLEHRISHTQDKPWPCEFCDKKFANLHAVQRHKRAKHTPSHLQQFSCCICRKTFCNQSILQTHLSTHASNKPYPCSICCLTFALKFTRDTHESQHTGNRPWSCNVCGKTYVTKYKLKAHMKGHTGELYCTICDQQFSSQDVLTRHKRRHDNPPSLNSRANKGVGGTKNKAFSSETQQNICRGNRNNKKKRTEAPPQPSPMTVIAVAAATDFQCQMCNKTFDKSADLAHHLASCSAIIYCSPVSVQTTQQDLLNPVHQQLPPPPANAPQLPPLPPSQSMSSYTSASYLIDSKKSDQFVANCEAPSSDSLIGLDQRSFVISAIPSPSLISLSSSPYPSHPVIQAPVASAIIRDSPRSGGGSVNLPDYLKEVDFVDSLEAPEGQG